MWLHQVFQLVTLVLSFLSLIAGQVVKNDTCPNTAASDILQCHDVRIISLSALRSMARVDPQLRNVLTNQDGSYQVYDLDVCNSYDPELGTCNLDKMTFFMAQKDWPYIPSALSQLGEARLCGIGYGDSRCNSPMHLTSECGNITAITTSIRRGVMFSYRDRKNCEWHVNVKEGKYIKFYLEFIYIKYCKEECLCDFVKIFDVVDGNETEIGRFCGRDSNKIIYTTSNRAKIVYVTIGSNIGLGFKMKYESVDSIDKVLSKPISVDISEGKISLDADNIQIVTPSERVYRWHIRVKETKRITGRWKSNSKCTIPSHLTISEGSSSYNKEIQTTEINNISENTFKSKGFQVFVELRIPNVCAMVAVDFVLNFSTEDIPYSNEQSVHGSVGFEKITLTEGSNSRTISLSSNNNDSPSFNILQVDVTNNLYISMKFKRFNFSGPNTGNCENEGILIKDGNQRTFGPYCGLMYFDNIFSLESLLRENSRSDPNFYPSFISASNQLVVIFYTYPNQNTKSSILELEFSATNCVGIYDIANLDQYDFLKVESTNIQNGVKLVTVVHQKPSCFQAHFFPSLQQVNAAFKVIVMAKDIYTSVKAINAPGYAYKCPKQIVSSGDVDRGMGFQYQVNMDCYYTSRGFIGHFSNIDTQSCVEKTYKEADGVTRVMEMFKGYPCGTLILERPVIHTYYFKAPIAMHTGYRQYFRISCPERQPCRPLQSVCDIEERSGPNERMVRIRGLRIWQVPFYWQTAWTFQTTLHCEMNVQRAAMIEFNTLPETETDLALEETELYECSKTSDAPERVGKYKMHCYSHHVTGGSSSVRTWNEAEEACEADGGTLVTITDEGEFDFIRHMLRTKWRSSLYRNNRIYIGLKGNTSSSHRWVDGNPLTVSDWYRPLPSPMQYLPLAWFGEKSTFASVKLEQPSNDPSAPCVAMVITNPVQPTNWIKLPCNYPYESSAFICKFPAILKPSSKGMKSKKDPTPYFAKIVKTASSSALIPGKIDCPKGWNFKQNRCVLMVTSQKPIDESITCDEARDMCKINGGRLLSLDTTSMYEYLKMWRHDFSYGDIWYGDCNIVFVNHSDHFFNNIHWKKQIAVPINTTLHALCETDPVKVSRKCGRQQFECDSGTCISSHHVCDGTRDCTSGEDEYNCTCTEQHFTCTDGSCVPLSKYCDFIPDCSDKSDELNCSFSTCSDGFKACDNGECIPEEKFYDFVPDCMDKSDLNGCTLNNTRCSDDFLCYSDIALPLSYYKNMRPDCPGQSQEDEPLSEYETQRGIWLNPEYKNMQNFNPYCPAGNGTEARCHDNHQVCFPRYETCQFVENIGCTDGSHLKHCKSFECPNMFKCPDSHCIPYNKVCDGVKDCNHGADEMDCQNYICPGMFQCKKEGYCVDQSQVCDGYADCKETRDDEALCDFLDCPNGCSCYGHSLTCQNGSLTEIPSKIKTLRSLLLPNNNLVLTNDIFRGYAYLGKLDISSNNIQNIPRFIFKDLNNLLLLDLRYNSIKRLVHGMFFGLHNLQHLLLQGNPIEYLGTDVFSGLDTIMYLNLDGHKINQIEDGAFKSLKTVTDIALSNNSLTYISHRVFEGTIHLQNLNIQGNDIYQMDTDTFDKMQLRQLHTDHFKFCCFAQKVPKCTPEGDVFSSCKDLMANGILQVAVWVLGVAALVGNIIVIGWRVVVKPKKADAFLIINLALSDFLMGVYLVIIASADTYYRNRYILYADYWMNSSLCKIAGFLATLSSEMSVFMLVVITADRLVAIAMPFSNKRLSLKVAGIVISLGWISLTILAALPVSGLPYFGQNYIQNGVCLLFNVSSGQTKGWEYTTFLFLLVNLAAFTFILVGYLVIYHMLDKSRRHAKREVSEADRTVARRFALIVGTDFICWVPILVTWFMSVAGMPVHPGVSAWIVVFIMPLNSALNPYLYTFTALHQARKRAGKKKNISGFTKSTSDGESKISKSLESGMADHTQL